MKTLSHLLFPNLCTNLLFDLCTSQERIGSLKKAQNALSFKHAEKQLKNQMSYTELKNEPIWKLSAGLGTFHGFQVGDEGYNNRP